MAIQQNSEYRQANESISKFKMLSSYGGAGSIVHTGYGSIIVSCIEEWGFINRIAEIDKETRETVKNRSEKEVMEIVIERAKRENIGMSNDTRLLASLIDRKNMSELKYLVLIPNIETKEYSNRIKDEKESQAINSTFLPKVFSNRSGLYRSYSEWYNEWVQRRDNDDKYGNRFFPPRVRYDKGGVEDLIQDNIVLICEHGHISDFPWSRFLRWKYESSHGIDNSQVKDLFSVQPCCGTLDKPTSMITIKNNSANASGFDGKRIKCLTCQKQASLQGLMSVKIKCPGHKPWEAATGDFKNYSGDRSSRSKEPPTEECHCKEPMKVALTTGNNLYYSRGISSIYIPEELLLSKDEMEIKKMEILLEQASMNRDWDTAKKMDEAINEMREREGASNSNEEISDQEKAILYRYDEFRTFTSIQDDVISSSGEQQGQLKVKEVTANLNDGLKRYFSRVLRIDNMKLTFAQLDFSRVVPMDTDAINTSVKNIFRAKPGNVPIYPVVENYGEGIFFSFDMQMLDNYISKDNLIGILNGRLHKLSGKSDDFSRSAIEYGYENNWQLYLVHTFSHLIMKELEFRCGYPTASLSERIYVSNDEKYKMYGCMIYTAEGAEGSMGGLIAQTSIANLNRLIENSIKRATVCNSDPLCYESDGQGLFDLNFASCFSCSLVSETSCEHRNIYLDRSILIDPDLGFFKEIIS